MLNIWKDNYVVRRKDVAKNVNGYSVSSYRDFYVRMDIQPAGSQSVMQSEGRRTTTTIQTISDFIMRTANARTGEGADLVWFNGNWYQCESSQVYRHTPMRHCTATFRMVTEAVDKAMLAPPNPSKLEKGWDNGRELD